MATDRPVMSAVAGGRGRLGLLLCLAAGLVTACAATEDRSPEATTAASAPPSAVSPGSLPILEEGAVAPGRYVVMPPTDGWAACADWVVDCPPEPAQARSLRVEITVPRGWEAGFEGTVLVPSAGSFASAAEGPAGAGVVIGWTGHPSGLHADPCQAVSHLKPDIEFGPTVDEFVDAVRAHPSLEITEPEAAELGGYRGRYFELTAPIPSTADASIPRRASRLPNVVGLVRYVVANGEEKALRRIVGSRKSEGTGDAQHADQLARAIEAAGCVRSSCVAQAVQPLDAGRSEQPLRIIDRSEEQDDHVERDRREQLWRGDASSP